MLRGVVLALLNLRLQVVDEDLVEVREDLPQPLLVVDAAGLKLPVPRVANLLLQLQQRNYLGGVGGDKKMLNKLKQKWNFQTRPLPGWERLKTDRSAEVTVR